MELAENGGVRMGGRNQRPYDVEANAKHEAHLQKVMYNAWLKESGETNESDMLHLKNCVRLAIQEALTDKQRQYIFLYLNGYNGVEISKLCGVNASTVCRTTQRAVNNLFSRIKYATPRTLYAEKRARKNFVRLYQGGRGKNA